MSEWNITICVESVKLKSGTYLLTKQGQNIAKTVIIGEETYLKLQSYCIEVLYISWLTFWNSTNM